MRKFFLIMIGLSVALMAELTRDAATGIVTDSATGLMWQDNQIGTTINWQGAINRCEVLELGGHSDWRLPNINELESIVDRNKVNPAIEDGFVNTISNIYRSSTTHEYRKDYVWSIHFNSGIVYDSYKYSNGYVRCVRVGQ